MKDFILEIFCTIYGLGAASGLWYDQGKLFVVSDNSNYLYEYILSQDSLSKHLLVDMDGENEQVKKKKKLDLESISKYNNDFYLFSSMSAPTRNHIFQKRKSRQAKTFSSEQLSQNIQSQLQLGPEDLNIEGSFRHKNIFYLFNRGNGPQVKNGIVLVKRDLRTPLKFVDVALPMVEGEHPGFTDAILVDDQIFFLAAIERTKSTYADGDIGGSFVGKINLQTLKVDSFQRISQTHKFEGITLYKESADKYTFLLCEDPDDNSLQTIIYTLSLPR